MENYSHCSYKFVSPVQVSAPMSSQTKETVAAPPPRSIHKTILDDLILTFSSPMAWLLMIALIITWAGVAIVLFDLLDYRTLAGIKKALSVFFFTIHFIFTSFNNEITFMIPL